MRQHTAMSEYAYCLEVPSIAWILACSSEFLSVAILQIQFPGGHCIDTKYFARHVAPSNTDSCLNVLVRRTPLQLQLQT